MPMRPTILSLLLLLAAPLTAQAPFRVKENEMVVIFDRRDSALTFSALVASGTDPQKIALLTKDHVACIAKTGTKLIILSIIDDTIEILVTDGVTFGCRGWSLWSHYKSALSR